MYTDAIYTTQQLTHAYEFLLEHIHFIHITETVLWYKHASQLNHIDSEMCFQMQPKAR